MRRTPFSQTLSPKKKKARRKPFLSKVRSNPPAVQRIQLERERAETDMLRHSTRAKRRRQITINAKDAYVGPRSEILT